MFCFFVKFVLSRSDSFVITMLMSNCSNCNNVGCWTVGLVSEKQKLSVNLVKCHNYYSQYYTTETQLPSV